MDVLAGENGLKPLDCHEPARLSKAFCYLD
jgi:hypothetical protein